MVGHHRKLRRDEHRRSEDMKRTWTRHKDMHGKRIYEGDYIMYPKGAGFVYKVRWGTDNSCFGLPWLKTWVVEGRNGLRTYLYDSSDNLLRVGRRP